MAVTSFSYEETKNVVIAKFLSVDEIVTGNEHGEIHLWHLCNGKTLSLNHVRSFNGHINTIVYLAPLGVTQFVSMDSSGILKIWNKNNSFPEIDVDLCIDSSSHIDCVILPGKLLAISHYCRGKPAWETVSVWDLETGLCRHFEIYICHRPHGCCTAVTTSGLLVAGFCCGDICVFDINKNEAKLVSETEKDRIYSLAALPDDKIVTAAHSITIYRLSSSGQICNYKIIEHTNVIDKIFPVGGYKFLTVDRSRSCSGTLKLWNYLSSSYDYLGCSRAYGFPCDVNENHSFVLFCKDNQVFVNSFPINKLKFPRNLAEIRKNARIVSQADRMESGLFLKLPQEIKIKIIVMTATNMDKYEEEVSKDFAWSHYGRPNLI